MALSKEVTIITFPMKKIPYYIVTIFFCGLFVAFLYHNSLDIMFEFDDYHNIVLNNNIHLQSLAIKDITNIVFNSVERPVAFVTFALNYYFGGLNVTGYHLINILIHMLTMYGMLLLINIVFFVANNEVSFARKSFIVALVSASLWAANPVHTQAVSYIVQRMASMAAMFYVYAFYFYIKGRLATGIKHQTAFFLISILLALLAFGTKQNTLTLPFFILLFELLFFQQKKHHLSRMAILLLLLAILFLALLSFFLVRPVDFVYLFTPYTGLSYVIKERFFTGVDIIVYYLELMLFPLSSRQSIVYDYPISAGLLEQSSTLFSLLLTCVFFIYAFYCIKRKPVIAFFIFWFFGNVALESFLPSLLLVQEHRLYLPSIGAFAVLTSSYVEMTKSRYQKISIALLVVVLVLFSTNTIRRNMIWQNPVALWKGTVENNPYSTLALNGLGHEYMRAGMTEKGIESFEKAKSIDPRDPSTRIGLGIAYYHKKWYDRALDEFEYAGRVGLYGITGTDTIDQYFVKVAMIYWRNGDVVKAENVLRQGLTIVPGHMKMEDMLKNLTRRSNY